jgi:hypothetical protein
VKGESRLDRAPASLDITLAGRFTFSASVLFSDAGRFAGMTDIRFGSISLDCADPRPLAEFWAGLLGGEIAFASDAFVAVRLENLWLTAVRVENHQPPTWPQDATPKQMHLDLAVKELDATSAKVVRLGATRCEFQPAPETYLVFLDPAGHPFCLTTQIPE